MPLIQIVPWMCNLQLLVRSHLSFLHNGCLTSWLGGVAIGGQDDLPVGKANFSDKVIGKTQKVCAAHLTLKLRLIMLSGHGESV